MCKVYSVKTVTYSREDSEGGGVICVHDRLLQLRDLCGRNWPCLCSAV